MNETLEEIIKKLRAISADIGKIENHDQEVEDHLDGATAAIQDAIDELEEIIART